MSFEKEIIQVSKEQFVYYKSLIKKSNNISEKFEKEKMLIFCDTAIKESFTIDKISRWLGFLQGILFMNDLISLEEERNRTRVLFQSIYKKYNIKQEVISI